MDKLKSGEAYFESEFSKLSLSDSRYESIEFEDCGFVECDFSSVQFKNCKFVNCRFEHCNLSLMNVTLSRLFGVTFEACKMVGIDWTRATWPMYHVDFELIFRGCILNDASFYGLTLNELVMEECKLHDVDFRDGNFTGSSLTYCDFTHSQFMRTNLQDVDFSESTDYAIDVTENRVKGAKFSRYEALNLLECLGIELVD